MLSDTLKSGKYSQTTGALYIETSIGEPDSIRNCCLGVMELEAGMEFAYVAQCMEWQDDLGMSSMPDYRVLSATGLYKQITEQEIEYVQDMELHDDFQCDTSSSRADTLAFINDNGGTFEDVAKLLVDLKWDIDLDAVKEILVQKGIVNA